LKTCSMPANKLVPRPTITLSTSSSKSCAMSSKTLMTLMSARS
jgi:hypothetical protein